jgi:hypothetical protein
MESAMLFSLNTPLIKPQTVTIVKYTGFIIYFVVMIILCIWAMATFPGYVNNDSLD